MSHTGPLGPHLQQDAVSMSSARAAVLNGLRERGGAVTVRELSDEFELHANTVREHLDALVDAGLVVRESTNPQGRGRPALTYRAAHATVDVARDYELLADVLADHMASAPDAAESARSAGQAWGRRDIRKGQVPDPSDIGHELSRLGFEPAPADEPGAFVLRACPVLTVARHHPGVVCGVHRGYVEALVEAAGGDGSAVEMVPMGHEHGCVLRVPLPVPAESSHPTASA